LSPEDCVLVLQDGSEKGIESLSLIDAVMPDVVESRKQARAKTTAVKAEPANTNGEENTATLREYLLSSPLQPG